MLIIEAKNYTGVIRCMKIYLKLLYIYSCFRNKKIEETCKLPTNFLSVLDHFVGLVLKGLKNAFTSNPANIYLFKINKKNTRKSCEICSKLTI